MCNQEECKRAYETGKVENEEALCPTGKFWFHEEDNMIPGQPSQGH